MSDDTKIVWRFSKDLTDGDGSMKAVLGGKGAGLAMMTKAGLNVPPGFTVPTTFCALVIKDTGILQKTIMPVVLDTMPWLESKFGCMPLVSIRSGAPISCPGMMDTILNVGLTTMNVDLWGTRIGERAAFDSYRRLIQMLGATAYGVPMEVFDKELAEIKKLQGVEADTDLNVASLKALCFMYTQKFKAVTQTEFPNTREEQLEAGVRAVFDSWMNPRAVEYRKINGLDDAMGTAVTVQAMVFGNMGDDSGSGVLFTRDPSTGHPGIMGEFLVNAQGEDVVAGIRTPDPLGKFSDFGWYPTLMHICEGLEASYSDMVDLEFTVQKGELFILQSRAGKRSARAAFRIAVDQVSEGLIERSTALSRLKVDQFKVVRRPSIDPKFKTAADVTGLPACPGVVTGVPVFSAADAVNCAVPCILVTHETNPNDIAGMAKAVGILTQTGGATSHAAVVARAMDKACVVGCTALDIEAMKEWPAGATLTVDGSTGRAWFKVEVPVIDSSDAPEVRTVMDWCREQLNVSVSASVDLGCLVPHRLMAAHWWGNEEVMESVLTGLASLPTRAGVVLDLRAPHEFMELCDAPLTDCFGGSYDMKFSKMLHAGLKARGGKLQGLGLAFLSGGEAYEEGFTKRGFKVDAGELSFQKNVPLDYATFTVLAD
jgi:pyruvate,orthophosphate dikinase